MYFNALDEFGDDVFEAKMGAEAIQDILSEMQLEKEAANLREDSGTKGLKSGGNIGNTFNTIHSGLFPELIKESTNLSRLLIFFSFV
jgi:hypothetical protein